MTFANKRANMAELLAKIIATQQKLVSHQILYLNKRSCHFSELLSANPVVTLTLTNNKY